MRILICALVALGWAGAALADDGNKLLEICKASEGSQSRVKCLGYVTGVHDAIAVFKSTGAVKISPCVPAGATPSQMADVVVKYLTENPKDRDYSAAGVVMAALINAWPPCNKPEK
jgi:hypothetical protein